MPRDVEDLQAQLGAALEKYTRSTARISATPAGPVPGDLYAFAATAADGVEWAVLQRHSQDSSLWFLVPYDQEPLVGTWDVGTSPDSDAEPGVLRCGYGIWAHVEDMLIGERSGFLGSEEVREARIRLAAMVDGNEERVRIRSEIDDDPDYEAWTGELARAAERLEEALRAALPTISVSSFRTDWMSAAGVPVRRPAALAAAGTGLGAAPATPIRPLPGAVISDGMPGALVAVNGETGLRLLYLPGESESVPKVRVMVKGSETVVRWREMPDRTSESIESLNPGVSPTILATGGIRLVLTV
jgi:hypothetical protein